MYRAIFGPSHQVYDSFSGKVELDDQITLRVYLNDNNKSLNVVSGD